MYEDIDLRNVRLNDSCRGVLSNPYIIAVLRGHKGAPVILPVFSFDRTHQVVTVGTEYRLPFAGCITLDKKNTDGKGMSDYGLSSRAIQITLDRSTDGDVQMEAKVVNSKPLVHWSARFRVLRLYARRSVITLEDGDEIRFARDAPYAAIRVVIPRNLNSTRTLQEAKALCSEKVLSFVEQMKINFRSESEKRRQELEVYLSIHERKLEDRLAAMLGKIALVNECKTNESVREVELDIDDDDDLMI